MLNSGFLLWLTYSAQIFFFLMELRLRTLVTLLLCVLCSIPAAAAEQAKPEATFQPNVLPVRALMLYGLRPASLDSMLSFIREDLPREGVNTLIFQIDYNYQYKTHPELIADHAFSEAQIK